MTIRLHGKALPADAGRHGVDDAILGAGDDLRRQIFIAQRRGIFGELDGLVSHRSLPMLREIASSLRSSQ